MKVKTSKRWFSSFFVPCAAFFRGSIIPVFLLFALSFLEASRGESTTADAVIPNYQVDAGGEADQAIVPELQWAMDDGQKRLDESLQDYFLPGFIALGAPLPLFLHSGGSILIVSGNIRAIFLRRLLFPFHSFL